MYQAIISFGIRKFLTLLRIFVFFNKGTTERFRNIMRGLTYGTRVSCQRHFSQQTRTGENVYDRAKYSTKRLIRTCICIYNTLRNNQIKLKLISNKEYPMWASGVDSDGQYTWVITWSIKVLENYGNNFDVIVIER
jgi:hypothetical protein